MWRMLCLACLAGVLAVAGAAGAVVRTVSPQAKAFDWTQWIMCSVMPAPANSLYQMTASADVPYMLRSKSAVTSGVGNVTTGLNAIMGAFGPGYAAINEPITGYSLDRSGEVSSTSSSSSTSTTDATSGSGTSNKGPKVTPFDRFGVAGLTFTSYAGEWKYIVVDACNTAQDPSDPKAGVFYEGRLEPKSTWEDVGSSPDIRTVQFNRGFGDQFLAAGNDIVANGVFTVTKAVVAVTVGLIDLAFSDIVGGIGVTALMGAGKGLFSSLFSGVFAPLVVLAFVVTGISVFWRGAVRREFRAAVGATVRSVLLFLAAVVVSVKPMLFVTLPNDVAVIGQTVLVSALDTGVSSSDGLCTTDVGSVAVPAASSAGAGDDSAVDQSFLTSTSVNARAAVGCQLWQMFLVQPWVQGQFGTGWNSLWADGHIASWAPSGATSIGAGNSSWTGNGEVPVGNGETIDNWALYQLSTQTNVHATTAHPGEPPKTTQGVANDWWRVVDALSNYQEQQTTSTVAGTGQYGGSSQVTYTAVKKTAPTSVWDTWTGNSAFSRVLVALSSVLVAAVGLAVPFVFALMSSVYALGTALLVAFAPIMFLLGCWDRGWTIFVQWAQLLVNTVLRRIATGLLLALSLVMTASALRVMSTVGWGQGVLLLVVTSVTLFMARHKIVDALATARFAAEGGMSQVADRIGHGTVKAVRGGVVGGAAVGGAMTVGAVSAHHHGGSAFAGAKSAGRRKLDQVAPWATAVGNRPGRAVGGVDTDGVLPVGAACAMCGAELRAPSGGVFHGARTPSGGLLCRSCARRPDVDSTPVTLSAPASGADRSRRMSPATANGPGSARQTGGSTSGDGSGSDGGHDASDGGGSMGGVPLTDTQRWKMGRRYRTQFLQAGGLSDRVVEQSAARIASGSSGMDDGDVEDAVGSMAQQIHRDVVMCYSKGVIPQIPGFLAPYVDESDMVALTETGDTTYITAYLAAAVSAWYTDEGAPAHPDADVSYEKVAAVAVTGRKV